MTPVREIIKGLPGDLPRQVSLYLEDHHLSLDDLSRADLTVALLRIGTEEALRSAERVCGREIKVCPPSIPPWPPVPVAGRPRGPVISRVSPNPCLPTTGAFQRYRSLRRGLSVDQLVARGITRRDLRLWARAGHIEWTRNG